MNTGSCILVCATLGVVRDGREKVSVYYFIFAFNRKGHFTYAGKLKRFTLTRARSIERGNTIRILKLERKLMITNGHCSACSSFNLWKNVMSGRWDNMEDLISRRIYSFFLTGHAVFFVLLHRWGKTDWAFHFDSVNGAPACLC